MRILNRRALRLRAAPALLLVVSLAAGCAIPAGHPALEQADAAVERARRSPRVRALAAAELDHAEVALQEARDAARAGATPDQVEHFVYIVNQRAALAEARAAQQVARSEIQMLEGALDQVLAQRRPGHARQRQASFPARDRQPRAPLQVPARARVAEDPQSQMPLQSAQQAQVLLQELQQARAPAEEPQQAQVLSQEPRPGQAPPLGPQQVRGSLAEVHEAAPARPDHVAANLEALPREITLSLAQLSFAGAEPTSETGARLAAVADQLLRAPERSVSIQAEFNLPEPEARTMLEQRVENVRAILLRRGVAPERVLVRASGDGPAEPRATPSSVKAPY